MKQSSTIQLARFAQAVAAVHEVHADLPVNALRCLLAVMLEDGLSQQQAIQRLKMPKATVSRNMRLISDRQSPTREGLGLIEMRPDPADYRFKQAHLTPKGEALRAKMLSTLEV